MCFNIIPKNLNTLLHYIGLGEVKDTMIINDFFETSSEYSSGYQIPYIQNFKGETPLELCLDYQKVPLIDVASVLL
jgi:hypothetical protein